ncbi:hypothetical protein CDD83_4823 [Cordyceps sp. RAO-2017]|nr:hypothetical protein CDD83_4823 [Cordyceps sp. RAO-2017]
MPNTGRPSRDCHLCRQRRVKCDLERPGCRRCFKYGVQCPGYRDQQDLVFRNVHPGAAGAGGKKRGKKTTTARAAPDDDDAYSSGGGSTTTALPPGASTMTTTTTWRTSLAQRTTTTTTTTMTSPPASVVNVIPPSLQEHWTAQSVPILLNVYSSLDFVDQVYRVDPGDGPLTWAAHLFSRTYVTNLRYPTAVHGESARETQQLMGTYLGRTLSSVSAALKTPRGPFRDDVLVTVWILANYELLVGSLGRLEPRSPWHLHTHGLYSILKARGNESLRTVEGRTAFWPCYNMVQVQALVKGSECPPESDEWLGIIAEAPFEGEALTLHVSVFVAK